MVDALVVAGRAGDRARNELRRHFVLEVPAVFDAESVSALRGMLRRGQLSVTRATAAVTQVQVVRAVRYPFEPFASRIWELREALTVYDAWYVALAEGLGTELITADERLTRASGPRCTVRLPG